MRAHFMKLQHHDKDGNPSGATTYVRVEDVRQVTPMRPINGHDRCNVVITEHPQQRHTYVLHEKATSFVTRVEKQIAALAEQHHPDKDDDTTAAPPPSNEPPTD